MTRYLHDDLIDVASDLAGLDAGRPRQACLRRAISTAYYALFHAMADLCAYQFAGPSAPWDFFAAPYRALNHNSAKTVLQGLASEKPDSFSSIAGTFKSLQERRHQADYDPTPLGLGRAETLDLIDQARQAVVQLHALSDADVRLLTTRLLFPARRSL
jgi:hypothetical protein